MKVRHLHGYTTIRRMISGYTVSTGQFVVCWHTMKRTTVKLTDEVDALLRHEAARRGLTLSELTREAIEAYLKVSAQRQLMAARAGKSGRTDISERIEEILRQEIVP